MDASEFSKFLKSALPAEARAGAALAVTELEIPGYAQDIALRLYRRPDKTGLPFISTAAVSCAARSTTRISPRAF